MHGDEQRPLEMLGTQYPIASPEDYGAAMQILETHCNFSIILLDCGTPVIGPFGNSNILNDVTGLVVVASEDVRVSRSSWSLWTGAHACRLFVTLWLFSTQSRKPGHARIAPPKTSSEARSDFFGFPFTIRISATGLAVRFQPSQAKDTQRRADGWRPSTALRSG